MEEHSSERMRWSNDGEAKKISKRGELEERGLGVGGRGMERKGRAREKMIQMQRNRQK